MNLIFLPADEKDFPEILRVQDEAFYEDVLSYGFCPGYGQRGEHLRKQLERCAFFKIMDGEKIIGVLRYHALKTGQCHLDCLCTHPTYQGKGIGQAALRFMEENSSGKEWLLETPLSKTRNVEFYQKSGYEIVGKEIDRDVELGIFLKKLR